MEARLLDHFVPRLRQQLTPTWGTLSFETKQVHCQCPCVAVVLASAQGMPRWPQVWPPPEAALLPLAACLTP